MRHEQVAFYFDEFLNLKIRGSKQFSALFLLIHAFWFDLLIPQNPYMLTVNLEEIARYRSALSEETAALEALDLLEDCEGNLEDAAISLALQVGQEPDRSDDWLEGLAKRWRYVACRSEIKDCLNMGALLTAARSLSAEADISLRLMTLVVIYIDKTGVESFCRPLEEKL